MAIMDAAPGLAAGMSGFSFASNCTAAAAADIRRAAGTPLPATSAIPIWMVCSSMGPELIKY